MFMKVLYTEILPSLPGYQEPFFYKMNKKAFLLDVLLQKLKGVLDAITDIRFISSVQYSGILTFYSNPVPTKIKFKTDTVDL